MSRLKITKIMLGANSFGAVLCGFVLMFGGSWLVWPAAVVGILNLLFAAHGFGELERASIQRVSPKLSVVRPRPL